MIDASARQRYFEENKSKSFMDGIFKSTSEALELKKENQKIMETIVQKDDSIADNFNKLGKAIAMVYKVIPRQLNIPKLFQIFGKVEIEKSVPIEVKNLQELVIHLQNLERSLKNLQTKEYPTNFVVDNLFELKEYFQSLEKRIGQLSTAISSIPTPKIEIPKFEIPKLEIPKSTGLKEIKELSDSLTEGMEKLVDEIKAIKFPDVKVPHTISVDNFPPQLVPHPVTNISINPLQGLVKTTATTVGTTLTTLPGYGRLFNRRALQIYNNSSNTIYYGGSDVTTSNGIPVTAGSFSNVIDAGYNMIVYGIASTPGNDIRVIEVASVTSTAGIQE